MTIKETVFTLDLTREGKHPVVKFRLNDNKVQKITFRLTNNGREIDLEREIGDQFKPVFECIFHDKTFKRDADQGNWEIKRAGKFYTFAYYLTSEVINKSGIACYYFALETPEGIRISTHTLKMVIDCDFKEGGKPSENYISEFDKLKKEADSYRQIVKDLDKTLKEVLAGGASITEVIESREDWSGKKYKNLKDRLDTEFATKANKSYVDSKIDSMASGSPKGVYSSLNDLQTAKPTGDSNIYVVIADGKWYYWNGTKWTAGGTYQATSVADKSVTPEKTTFIHISSNMFNKNDSGIKNGKRVSSSEGGDTAAFANSSVSGFIPIINGETYTYGMDASVYGNLTTYALYDANKSLLEFKSGTLSADKTYVTVTIANVNAKFIKVNVSTKTLNTFVFCKGIGLIPYENYGMNLDSSFTLTTTQKEEIREEFSGITIEPKQTTFIKVSNNMFNKNDLDIQNDRRVTTSEGSDTAYFKDSSVTGFIPVQNSKTYSYPTNFSFYGTLVGVMIYDGNKRLIGSVNGTLSADKTFITVTLSNPNVKYVRVNVKTTDIPTFMFSEGSVLRPYEDYGTTFDDTFVLSKSQKDDVVNLIESKGNKNKIPINLLLPKNVYVTCNDITSDFVTARQHSAAVYLDHTLENAIDEHLVVEQDTSEEQDKLSFYSQASFSGDVLTINNGKNIDETTREITVSSYRHKGSGTVKQVSTKASLSKTKFPRVLCIGDSITYGVGASAYRSGNGEYAYWGYAAKLFELDRIDGGNNPAEYNFVSLGTRGAGGNVAIKYKGVEKTVRAACEGYSGWLLADILHHGNTLPFNQATWDALGLGNGSGTDYTGTIAQRNLICLTNQNDTSAVPANAFFDNSKAGDNKFSIAKWIERYRTLDDNGTRLELGNGTGSQITSSNINLFNVCTPTHVVITIGRNDLAYCDENTFIQNMNMFIAQIKSDLPNAIIAIVITPDDVGTMFPKRYNNIIDSLNVGERKFYSLASRLMTEYENRESENIYLVPFYFVQPTAWGQPLYRVDMPESIFGLEGFQKDGFLKYRPLGIGANIHPGSQCHAAWGYQLYSWLKYVLIK